MAGQKCNPTTVTIQLESFPAVHTVQHSPVTTQLQLQLQLQLPVPSSQRLLCSTVAPSPSPPLPPVAMQR